MDKTTAPPYMSVRNLTTSFPLADGNKLTAVDHVSFDLYQGETLGIVGESGSGKSAMIKSILKLIPKPGRIESGHVYLAGQDILSFTDKQMRKLVRGVEISMIFQEPMTALNPSFTVESQIGEVYKIHTNLNAKERKEKIIELLKKVRIPEPERRMKEYPHQFSGGMRQRVLIALALACNPKVLFADEPTTALDVTVQADIMDLLEMMKSLSGLSIILISHNLNLVTERSDRIIVFYAGSIMEMASSADIAQEPLHPYTAGLKL
jgi:ABC-type dipeptide/oligopeptide/nickel transport system ATPase component